LSQQLHHNVIFTNNKLRIYHAFITSNHSHRPKTNCWYHSSLSSQTWKCIWFLIIRPFSYGHSFFIKFSFLDLSIMLNWL